MSDPVTNVEIEDVLSSIRRLVSADARPAEAEAEPQEEPPIEAEAELVEQAEEPMRTRPEPRLVLTPHQRVDTAEVEEETDEVAIDPEVQNALDRAVAAEGAVEGQDDAAFEDVEVVDLEPGDVIGEKLPEFILRREAILNEGVADPSDDNAGSTDEGDVANLDDLAARAAHVEEALAEAPDEWEPDGSSNEGLVVEDAEPLPWNDAKPAADDEVDDASVEAAILYAPEVKETTDETDDHDWLDGDAVMDEDALRDMVAEIVRQELQGALGERITRNVRKLVRREIHRALSSQPIE